MTAAAIPCAAGRCWRFRRCTLCRRRGRCCSAFTAPPAAGRDTFPVTAPSLLTAEEGVSTLVTAEEPETDPALAAAIAAGRVRAVNLTHPRYEELLPPLRRRERVRVNLLALGDVGSTLLMGLRLLGGDVIDSIGICDVRENVPQRWEMELNQIVSAGGGEIAAGGDRIPGGGV